MNDQNNDRFTRFLLVIRQAFLLVVGWIEGETNTRGKAASELRVATDIHTAPLQFRHLTEKELDEIANRVANKVLTRIGNQD